MSRIKSCRNAVLVHRLYEIKRAEGVLPLGKMGKVQFEQIVTEVLAFKKKLDQLQPDNSSSAFNPVLKINKFRLSAKLEDITEDGMILYRYARMRAKDMIRGWIYHLVLNSTASENEKISTTTILAGKDSVVRFEPVPESLTCLQQLLELFHFHSYLKEMQQLVQYPQPYRIPMSRVFQEMFF